MKLDNILVGSNGATLALTGGQGVAVYPARKGDKESYVLLESGKTVRVAGSRINGVGVTRYLTENGFVPALPGNEWAAKLEDFLNIRDGKALVEEASMHRAKALQSALAGKTCTYVPFDSDAAPVQVDVKEPELSSTTAIDLAEGFSSGVVRIAYKPGSGLGDIHLSRGWLVGPDDDATTLPRNTEYGGPFERAAFIIRNCGLATLIGKQNLETDEGNAIYPRGELQLALTNGDRLTVGITAGDELDVVYRRNGAVLYSHARAIEGRLGDVIGTIAAALAHVKDLDEQPKKKARKKAA